MYISKNKTITELIESDQIKQDQDWYIALDRESKVNGFSVYHQTNEGLLWQMKSVKLKPCIDFVSVQENPTMLENGHQWVDLGPESLMIYWIKEEERVLHAPNFKKVGEMPGLGVGFGLVDKKYII